MNKYQIVMTLIMLILLIPISVGSETSDLIFSIQVVENTDIHLDADRGSTFTLVFEIQVDNPTSKNIGVGHPDTCGFGIRINYTEHSNWIDNSGHRGCGDAFTSTIFEPGINELSLRGSIFFINGTNFLPDGQYFLSIFESTSGRNKISVLDFFVNQGELNIGIQSNSSLSPAFSVGFTLGTLFCILIIKDRSTKSQ